MDMEFEDSSHGSSNQTASQGPVGTGIQTNETQRHLPWVVNNERGSRYFCPVRACPHANLTHARGWANLQGVRNHLIEHYAGRFSGAVPQAFLDAHNLCSCSVCGKIISRRFNGTCPACRPTQRAATNNGPLENPTQVVLPPLDHMCMTRARLLKYVPCYQSYLGSGPSSSCC